MILMTPTRHYDNLLAKLRKVLAASLRATATWNVEAAAADTRAMMGGQLRGCTKHRDPINRLGQEVAGPDVALDIRSAPLFLAGQQHEVGQDLVAEYSAAPCRRLSCRPTACLIRLGRLVQTIRFNCSVLYASIPQLPGGTSSHVHVPGRVPPFAEQIPRGIRRKVCLGLKELVR